MEIPSDTRAAGAARRFAAARLDEWGCAEFKDDAVLICSELTANAALHGRTMPEGEGEYIHLNLTWQPGNGLVIEVEDNSTTLPAARDAGTSAEAGRGLALVATLADQWASDRGRDGRGKKVWARLRSSRTPLAA
ncbi:ATP-binding protein [Streptomyces sp. NPDC059835]|uniref:ATP-binding protein n=1 Tax=unclassified Streptomyces TaxID=2593676 RepID=UPI0036574169